MLYLASSIIFRVWASTSCATLTSDASCDNAASMGTGLIMPIMVLPCSVYTEMRHGSAMFKRMSVESTLPACPGLHTSKTLQFSAKAMPLLRSVVPSAADGLLPFKWGRSRPAHDPKESVAPFFLIERPVHFGNGRSPVSSRKSEFGDSGRSRGNRRPGQDPG